ncbi:MAG: hypothetical protein H6834_10540 [Planctomycetes bacterium]|nr:hypothetical protein [Planctomycetota bacterium]
MRYIPLRDQEPNPEWVTKAADLVADLKNAADADARNEIIDKNSALWGELKEWLLELSHGKCWFSEVKEGFSHYDVEHYRPKKSAKDRDGTPHDGYWWLAFDWENYRICGNAGNRKKGTFFPLREGCTRIGIDGDLRQEIPMLLDPIDEDDPILLFFDLEGHAVAAPHVKDEWEMMRVEYSVERYNLDFPPLMDKRKTVWAECWYRIKEYRRELDLCQKDPTNAVARDRWKQAAKRLRTMIREDQELSAVARACVESTGDSRLAGLLRSA